MNKYRPFLFTVLFFAILLSGYFLFRYLLLPKIGNHLEVEDQPIGREVVVNNASFVTYPTLLVAQSQGQYNNPEAYMGAVNIDVPDDYKNIKIPITSSPITPDNESKDSIIAYVTLYRDINDSREFERTVDLPVKDIFGNRVRVKFRLFLNE